MKAVAQVLLHTLGGAMRVRRLFSSVWNMRLPACHALLSFGSLMLRTTSESTTDPGVVSVPEGKREVEEEESLSHRIGKTQAQATLKTTPTMISHHQSRASPSLSAAAQGRGRVPCQSPAFMRGFIFIWWSCGPLFPEWIIRICLRWALFICSAVAESIRSVLHTIFKIIRDRQHNSHSIRIQMSADGGAATHSQKQTQLIFTAEADSLRSHCAFSSTQPAHILFPSLFFFTCAEIADLVLWTHGL